MLELNDEQLERNDDIDNAVFACITILAEKDLDWNMEMIGTVTESIKTDLLKYFNIKVRHPGIITNEDGSQYYAE